MPVMLRHVSRISRKRHTWPEVEHLETIHESPRAPMNFDTVDATINPEPQSEMSVSSSCIERSSQLVCDSRSPEELRRAQMIWYSHHFAESQQDRERLSLKIKELELAYRAQSKTNACLRKDVNAWQNSYDLIEAELVEAAQEIEEAKAYVRSIETSNANLRYALSQANERSETEKQARWRYRILKLVTGLRGRFLKLLRLGEKKNIRQSLDKVNNSREGSETPVTHSRTTKNDRSGAYSRLGERMPDPDLPSSSPPTSPYLEKG